MHLQEQLTRLTELQELIVHAPRPLEDNEALRRLPLLVIFYRIYQGPEVSCKSSGVQSSLKGWIGSSLPGSV